VEGLGFGIEGSECGRRKVYLLGFRVQRLGCGFEGVVVGVGD
jgi:hypothetical protein